MIDLHHHFDGAFGIDALYAEAKRRNLPQGKLSAAEFKAKCQVQPDCRTLTEFLAVFDFFYDIAQDADFLHNEAKKLPQRMADAGVVYLETRFAPHLFTGNLTPERVTESVVSGLEAGKSVPVRLILCAMRNSPVESVQDLIGLYKKFHSRGVCGIDLAGDESRYACREYAPVFQEAHEAGIPITIHAGEAAGPQSVYDALDLFKARRIGHGIRSIDDPALLKVLRERDVPLEVCPTSNVRTGTIASLETHPLRRLWDAGVPIVLGTDDPALFQTTLLHEYSLAAEVFGFSRDELAALAANSLKYRFQPTSATR